MVKYTVKITFIFHFKHWSGSLELMKVEKRIPNLSQKLFLLPTQLFSPTRLLNFGKISAYSSVPNRLAGPNKSAGGKILEKE